jgi:hypothetical protein
MDYPSLDEVKKMIALADERLKSLKALAGGLNALGEEDASMLRIAIGDVITPLNLAIEATS